MDWVLVVVSAVAGYLLGSFPTGYLMGKAHRVDIRRFGSGRTGGTNVLRTLGWLPALITAAVDVLKGMAAVWLARALGAPAAGHAAAALFAVLGHNYTFTLKFKGGAGVAPMVGATALLSFPVAAALLPVGVAVMAVSRYASLGSLTLSALFPLGMAIQWVGHRVPFAYLAGSVVMSVVVILAHRPNIRRLVQGTERKIGQRVAVSNTDERQAPPGATGSR
ncbi:MAG: glycerol-3-phosphate 1-O-acyltransferase PlsY [Chloroflexi bacterium]|nr:glycerol-3-phosphate 1-O-acyltransferase PlsY [Chloroflexota bacterium]